MKKHKLILNDTITSWDEAIPLGNGIIGCLFWGPSNALRLSLDRCDLWDTADAPEINDEYSYKNLVKLSREGNEKEIERIFDTPYSRPRPTKLPAGRIELDFGKDINVISSLDIATAEAEIKINDVILNAFLDANNEVGFFKANRRCSIKIINPEFGVIGENEINDPAFKSEQELLAAQIGNMQNLKYELPIKANVESDGITYEYFIQKTSEAMTYGLFVGYRFTDDGIQCAFTVQKDKSSDDLISKAILLIDNALHDGYDSRFNKHVKWWNDFWNDSYIKLDDEFFEYNWYLGNYFLASCSKKGYFPMALQGVWTADNGKLPPWKGDYHHNLNTQLSYLSYMKANHISQGECFVDYLLSLEDKAEVFARDFYGIPDGLCLPSVMDIEGNALGGWPMYAMNPSNVAWLCDSISDLYDYTKDASLLRDRIYPYIKKFGIFLSHILEKDSGGYLVLPFSSSPEVHDNTAASFLTPNSSYDLALIKNVFEDLIRFADVLSESDDKMLWEKLYNSMQPIHVDESGIMISKDERLFESHHMASHLMAIHPLHQLDYGVEDDRKLIDRSVEFYESFGYYLYVGYTFAQRAELYAIQGKGDKAYNMLKMFWDDFCLKNGFHCNGDYKNKYDMLYKYRPFTLEGNMCAIDALQEMLLQDHHGKMVISPAVPDEWSDYSFKMRSKCGVMIEAKIVSGKLVSVDLNAYADCSFPLYFKDRYICTVELKKDESANVSI